MSHTTYENELEMLVDKFEGVNEITWEDIVNELPVDYCGEYLRKQFTSGRYSGYNVYKYFKDKEDSGYSDEELDRLEELRQELYKEKVKLSDKKREYRKSLAEEARYENLVDVLKEGIGGIPEMPTFKAERFENSGVSASLLLSDLHYGAQSDNVLNLYNTDICVARMQQLFDKVVYYCSLHRVQTLYVNLMGDLVSGAIHCSTRVEQEEDIVSQTIHVSELIANFVSKLTQYVPEIKIIGVLGNHSRVTPNIKESINAENFERFVFEYIKLRLPNIPMIVNGLEDWCLYKIGERNIYIEHGDKCTPSSIRDNCINLTGVVPDECYMGHLHHHEVRDENGTVVVLNGSVMSTDSFAMRKRLASNASQTLRVYDRDVCTYNIQLD